jgi:hypothetical protein
MSDDTERSVASAGSQPVAWAVEFDGEVEPFCLSFDKGKAIYEAGGVGRVVALYRSPTLTDAEREAIAWFSIYSDTPGEERHAVVLEKLIARCRVDFDR